MLLLNHETFDPRSMVRYLPVSAFYIVSMAIGCIGLRYLELSVSSPVCNSSGGAGCPLCFLFLGQTMTWVQFAAVALVMLGVVLLSVFDLKGMRIRPGDSGEKSLRKSTGSARWQWPFLFFTVSWMRWALSATPW